MEVVEDGQQFVGPPAHVAFAFQQGEARFRGVGVAGLGHALRRRAGRQQGLAVRPGGRKDDLAGHDQAAGLLPAFGQALFKGQLVGALTLVFGHGADIAARSRAGNGGPPSVQGRRI